jgi:hypothetical protein
MKRMLVGMLVACGALVACGSEPPPKAPEPPPPEPARVERPAPKLAATQELGSIDEKATNKQFERLQSQLLDCQKQAIRRVEYLAGDIRVFLRIAQDGTVRWSYLEQSTLGDRETEKCMLGVLSSAHWPEPEGGEAEVQKSMSFDGVDARPPTSWPSDKVSGARAKQGDDAMQCKAGVKGAFTVTAYVEPAQHKKDKFGKVLAVGVASPNKEGEAKADCIADAVMQWKLPSPGGYAAKVTFNL